MKPCKFESKLKERCELSGIPYTPPACNESAAEKRRRHKNIQHLCRTKDKNTGKNELQSESEPFQGFEKTNPRSQNRLPRATESQASFEAFMAKEFVHPNPRIRAAMWAFTHGDLKHECATCDVCLETRLHAYDSTKLIHDNLPERRRLQARFWNVQNIPNMKDGSKACERCLKMIVTPSDAKREQSKLAHPFSGWLSPQEFRSTSGRDNNMHFFPVSSYLMELSEFEISCLAKYSFAVNIHVMGSSLRQKGCVAHVLSTMKVVHTLPRLPSQIEVIIIHHAPAHANSETHHRIRKQYGVRRTHLERGLLGLMYGVPKGGLEEPPPNCTKRYIKYPHRDHIDGTKLHGRYFEVC